MTTATRNALYDLLEHEVLPLFRARDDDGIPHGWVKRVKASLRTNGPRFSASRMLPRLRAPHLWRRADAIQ